MMTENYFVTYNGKTTAVPTYYHLFSDLGRAGLKPTVHSS